MLDKIAKIGAMVNYSKPAKPKPISFKKVVSYNGARPTNFKDIYAYEYKTSNDFFILKW